MSGNTAPLKRKATSGRILKKKAPAMRPSAKKIRDHRKSVGASKNEKVTSPLQDVLGDVLAFNDLILANAPIGILVYKATGRCLFANPAAARITGGSIAQLLAQNFRRIESWSRDGLLEAAKEALAANALVQREIYSTSTFGKEAWYDARFLPCQGKWERHLLVLIQDITERKQAEIALRESEEKFRIAAESARVMFGIYQGDRLVYANRYLAEMTGCTVDELLSIDLFQLAHPDFRKTIAERARRRQKGESVPSQYEFIMLPRHGGQRWLEFSTALIEYHGKPAIIGTALDITDRKRAEEALRQSETKYRAIFEGAPEGILVADPVTRRFAYANPVICKMLGYTEQEVVQLCVDHLHPREHVQHLIEEFEAHAQGKKTLATDIPCLRKDGSVFYADINSRPLVIEGRALLVGFFADITERRRAAEALRLSEARYRQLIDQAADGIFLLDEMGRFVLANGKACAMLGYTEPELYRLNILDTYPGGMEDAGRQRFAQIRLGKSMRFERLMKRKDGSVFMVEISATRLTDGRHQAIIHDITERKRAEEERDRLSAQLRDAQKLEAIGRFGRGVAHDFNNLMATVLGAASNMKSKRRPDDPDYEKLVYIEDAAETASKLAHQLLNFAKGGKMRPDLLPFAKVIDSALALVPPMVPQKVILDHLIASNLWQVTCDQMQIQQVIVNLCRNALEAMPDGGRLAIKAENVSLDSPLDEAQPPLPAGPYVCLSVADTGCGMDAETKKRMFEPFFTTKSRGHGLGLAAAYGVMAAHGGGISANSEPGKGSTFTLWLPRAKRPEVHELSR